jgi:hypothetical protein
VANAKGRHKSGNGDELERNVSRMPEKQQANCKDRGRGADSDVRVPHAHPQKA